MREFLWRLVARIVCIPAVTSWLIRRAQRTPYAPITGPDGTVYMDRWWLFNPYKAMSDGEGKRWSGLPSVRIHHIQREDSDRHLHDHPWNARTIVLRGHYLEERYFDYRSEPQGWVDFYPGEGGKWFDLYKRARGYTGRLLFGQFHRIKRVSDGGVWTLFITWESQGTWGFDVEGNKVPWREYLGIDN